LFATWTTGADLGICEGAVPLVSFLSSLPPLRLGSMTP